MISVDRRRLDERLSEEMSHERFIERLHEARFSHDEILDIELSYNFARFGHRDQYRQSGEPYFEHPRAVALQLIAIRTALLEAGCEEEALAGVTKDGIVLALHHDTVEDTKLFGGEGLRGTFASEISAFRLLWTYGVDVMCGIEALTKVEAGDHGISREEAKQASVDKVTASDPMTRRVKQSDRLHNLRTLAATPMAKQRRIVQATQEHYVPSWERDAHAEEAGSAVSQILLALVEETIEGLHASWERRDASGSAREPASSDGADRLDIERATAYAIIEEIPGLRIVERQLIHFAYDIAAYGNTSSEDAGQDGGLTFDQIKDATFGLIDAMTRRGAHDWKLLSASLLRDTVEHDYIFGSDAIPGMQYQEVAARNIGKIFGSEVRELVLSQTRAPGARGFELNDARRGYLQGLRAAGASAVLLQMTDAVERLKRVRGPTPDTRELLTKLDRDYMPIFLTFAPREGRLQPLLERYLEKIHRERARIDLAWNG